MQAPKLRVVIEDSERALRIATKSIGSVYTISGSSDGRGLEASIDANGLEFSGFFEWPGALAGWNSARLDVKLMPKLDISVSAMPTALKILS